MGFFKDLKEDLSQAVNELSDDATKLAGGNPVPEDDEMVNTLAEDEAENNDFSDDSDLEASLSKAIEKMNSESEPAGKAGTSRNGKAAQQPAKSRTMKNSQNTNDGNVDKKQPEENVSDEKAIITPGLLIKGDVTSSGSIELLGMVEGNGTCKGKLIVSGTIKGNISSADFFSDKANITGDVTCTGPAKIGTGSVIIGDLVASSAVISGAIKGNIDVQGPVIVDTTAIVMGDIKSKLVQINNGAVIEGYCSQCYSDNSPKKFFGEE